MSSGRGHYALVLRVNIPSLLALITIRSVIYRGQIKKLFRVTQPYLYLLVKPRFFSGSLEKYKFTHFERRNAAGKELTSWLSFVVSNCEFVTFHWYPGSGVVLDSGPSLPIQKWSNVRSHRVAMARERGEHERGLFPLLVRGVGGSPPRKFLNFGRFYVRF